MKGRTVRGAGRHMYYGPGKAANAGKERSDLAHHNFHGAHFPGKLAGAVDLAIYPAREVVAAGRTLKFSVQIFNGKAGHMIPSGSSEERMLWLEVKVRDASGAVYDVPVQPAGFDREEYTIADPAALAYQAMGEIMGVADFNGLSPATATSSPVAASSANRSSIQRAS